MSTSASASMSTSRSSMETHRIKLRFNPTGQPIGPTAATFSSNIGRIVKTHVPPIYNSWKKVPHHLKEDVWKHLLTLFDVPECHRPCVLTKANASWRDWKCDLRRKVYDKYATDAERKNALPQYLKKEDCENFVDSVGSFEAQLRRSVGKAARASLKSPHTSGRKGQARVADELQQQHPEREVTRCEIFIKTHCKKDGTATSHHVVFGTDTRGRVRGLGLGVSRTIVHNSNPYKRAYEKEHKSHVALETEVDGLKSRMEDMEKIVASLSRSGMQMRSSTDHESSSRVRPLSTHQETQASSRATLTGTYKLMHLRKSTVVAYGSLMGVSPDNSDYYRIVIDEIVDGDIELMDGVRKMEDIMLADIIDWPTFRTFPC